jgi:hypothetical protein
MRLAFSSIYHLDVCGSRKFCRLKCTHIYFLLNVWVCWTSRFTVRPHILFDAESAPPAPGVFSVPSLVTSFHARVMTHQLLNSIGGQREHRQHPHVQVIFQNKQVCNLVWMVAVQVHTITISRLQLAVFWRTKVSTLFFFHKETFQRLSLSKHRARESERTIQTEIRGTRTRHRSSSFYK